MRMTNVKRIAGGFALAVAGVLMVAPSAWADEADALNFIVGQTLTYDDNLFRLSDSVDETH